MAYDKFNILTSTAVPLSIENVDTDLFLLVSLKQQSELVLATTFSRLAIQQ
jgi:3-isopropylmalate/(R)-2-methylmalate dehydratase small subunit